MMTHHNVYYLTPTRSPRPLVRNYAPPKPKVHSATTVLVIGIIGVFVMGLGFSIMAPLLSEGIRAYVNSH